MGFIGSMFSNSQGSGFQGTSANIAQPVNTTQTDAAANAANNGLGQYQSFVNALQSQNGLQNQSNIFNQLQGVANGQGPNPAQAMLNQSTGQNVANQAALMAGQRGAGANTGLIARQAGQEGGALQQQAVGQGAALQAQQSLGALNQMGGIAGQQVGQLQAANTGYNQATQSEQQQLLNSIQGWNNANVANQSNINNVNAQLAQGNQATQGGIFSGLLNGAGGATSMMGGGGGGGAGAASAAMAEGGQVTDNKKIAQDISNGFNNATAYGSQPQPAATPVPVAQNYDDGGEIMPSGAATGAGAGMMASNVPQNDNAPSSFVGQFLQGNQSKPQQSQGPMDASGSGYSNANLQKDFKSGYNIGQIPATIAKMIMMKDGGKVGHSSKKVPVMLSPGEEYLSPHQASLVAKGKADPMSGKKVPGKAEVPGDSLKNDKVPAKLEKGGVVVKRSVMATHDPEQVRNFVNAVMAKSTSKRR